MLEGGYGSSTDGDSCESEVQNKKRKSKRWAGEGAGGEGKEMKEQEGQEEQEKLQDAQKEGAGANTDPGSGMEWNGSKKSKSQW